MRKGNGWEEGILSMFRTRWDREGGRDILIKVRDGKKKVLFVSLVNVAFRYPIAVATWNSHFVINHAWA